MDLPAGRRWRVEEADAALPGLTSLVESLRSALVRARDRPVRPLPEGGDRGLVVRGVVDLLAVDGVVLRDLGRGLVDFPARTPDGRDYWLCWVVGEPAVTWWHWPEDGFAGRQPLDQPPG